MHRAGFVLVGLVIATLAAAGTLASRQPTEAQPIPAALYTVYVPMAARDAMDAPSPTPPATVTPTATPPAPGSSMFGEGTFRVGSDIDPGTYRAPGGEFCSWSRLSGFSGDFDDLLAIGLPDGPTIVTILPTDAGFESGGCGEWSPQPTSGPEARAFAEGTFEVGVDIAPGTYRADGGDFCSWYRLSGFTGDSDDVLAIGLPEGQAIVTILASDTGFESSGCGEWTLQPETGPQVTTFGDGVFEVGVDIAPGTYQAPGGEFCSWYRLSGFTGDFDEILAIELPEGQAIATILPSDRGFQTHDCGTWTLVE